MTTVTSAQQLGKFLAALAAKQNNQPQKCLEQLAAMESASEQVMRYLDELANAPA